MSYEALQVIPDQEAKAQEIAITGHNLAKDYSEIISQKTVWGSGEVPLVGLNHAANEKADMIHPDLIKVVGEQLQELAKAESLIKEVLPQKYKSATGAMLSLLLGKSNEMFMPPLPEGVTDEFRKLFTIPESGEGVES